MFDPLSILLVTVVGSFILKAGVKATEHGLSKSTEFLNRSAGSKAAGVPEWYDQELKLATREPVDLISSARKIESSTLSRAEKDAWHGRLAREHMLPGADLAKALENGGIT